MSRCARLFVARRCHLLAVTPHMVYCKFFITLLYCCIDGTVSAGCYLLFCATELFLSVSAASFIPDVRRLPSNRISDIRRVLSRLRRAITICPTMSNIGFKTMLGLPPAIPTRTIKTKISRKICSMPLSTECASVMFHLLSLPSCRTPRMRRPCHPRTRQVTNWFSMFGLDRVRRLGDTGRGALGFLPWRRLPKRPITRTCHRPVFRVRSPEG